LPDVASFFLSKFFLELFLDQRRQRDGYMRGYAIARPLRATQWSFLHGERLMYFVAAVLAVLAGLFYAAGNNEIGSLGPQMCQYGSTFCDHPSYVLAGAVLAALWAAFVSMR
jgi:hypothetical protein